MVRALLDTCVVSESVRPTPNEHVSRRIDTLGHSGLYLSVVTIAEITRGLSQLGEGRRRQDIEHWLKDVEDAYGDRILPVDIDVARIWGQLTADLRARGFQIAAADGLIAATALAHNLAVVTRNVKDFERTGVPIINPWLDEDDA